ncbi:MAG: hypothetical protein AB8B99_23700 [Phormidesmis sp.]
MTTMTLSEVQKIVDRDNALFLSTVQTTQMSAIVNSNKITAEAFWWGFHIVIPESALKKIENASDIGKVISGLMGAGFGMAGIPPVAICISIITAVWGVESAAIKKADHGKGVYLSWVWPQVAFIWAPPYVQSLPLPTAI